MQAKPIKKRKPEQSDDSKPHSKKPKFSKKPTKPQEDVKEDWTEFKKKKKELRLKRRETRIGSEFGTIQKAKKLGETVRRKTLKGGEMERTKLVNELHTMLKGKNHYAKFVLMHDMARLVQWLLKYSSKIVVEQISKEIVPVTLAMLTSKYGVHCVKRLLKHGSKEVQKGVLEAMQGSSVKLCSHSISASVLEYAFTNVASAEQKQFLIQEFYGDLYKNTKDKEVKHIRDVYKTDETLKAATLTATKANLTRVINKNLLDSSLVHSVLHQFFQECSSESRSELITSLIPHAVVISNSKDGSKVVQQCIWHGTNKDRKQIIKLFKEHIKDLAKHENGHATVITLIDSTDDTVLLQKALLTELLKNAKDLASNEWGRKVLLWLVAPADSTCFHPQFIKELKTGQELSTSKKTPEIRRKELINYSIETLVKLIVEDPEFWLKNNSLALEMVAILKAAEGELLKEALEKVAEKIVQPSWKVMEKEAEVQGIEHAGMHMILKKLVQHDKVRAEQGNCTFSEVVCGIIDDKVLDSWTKSNRGCFLLVTILENSPSTTQQALSSKLKKIIKTINTQTTQGSKILLKKLQ